MKRLIKPLFLVTLALALLLAQSAIAEPADAVKGIYDALLAEDSDYSLFKLIYPELYEDMTVEETLEDDGFTIAIAGSEDMDGSLSFVLDGDYLVATPSGDILDGADLISYVVAAASDYFGMNKTLATGYVSGVMALGLDSKDFSAELVPVAEDDDSDDEAEPAFEIASCKLSIAGPWEMAELDQMVLDEATLFANYVEPLLPDEESAALAGCGKLDMFAYGSAANAMILLGEYGGLDDLAYQSIINAVNALQPNGYEDFVANYTELADAEASGYTVALNVDEAAVADLVDELDADYSYALISFGA